MMLNKEKVDKFFKEKSSEEIVKEFEALGVSFDNITDEVVDTLNNLEKDYKYEMHFGKIPNRVYIDNIPEKEISSYNKYAKKYKQKSNLWKKIR